MKKIRNKILVVLFIITLIIFNILPKSFANTSEDNMYNVQESSNKSLATIKIDGYFDYKKANEVLTIVNKERANNGLAALKMDRSLLETAMQRAAETSIYWDHIRPDGTYCFTANNKMKL